MDNSVIAYLIPTHRAIEDQPTRKWSYIDIFWFVRLPKELNSFFYSFYIVGKINKAPSGPVKAVIKVNDPDGNLFAEVNMEGIFQGGDADLVADFGTQEFRIKGKYVYSIIVNGKLFEDPTRYYFEVT